MTSSTLFFFFKISFSCSSSCTLSYKFQEKISPISIKNYAAVLIEITLNFYINLKRTEIFTILSLLIHSYHSVCHSIYVDFFGFFSLALCSFQHTGRIHVLLDLHLSVSLFFYFFRNCKWYFNFYIHLHVFIAGM